MKELRYRNTIRNELMKKQYFIHNRDNNQIKIYRTIIFSHLRNTLLVNFRRLQPLLLKCSFVILLWFWSHISILPRDILL